MATDKKEDANKNTRNDIIEELKNLLNTLGEHKVYTYISLLVTTIIAGQIFVPNYSKTVIGSLLGLMGDISKKSVEEGKKISSSIKKIYARTSNYVGRNKFNWKTVVITYFVAAIIITAGGIIRQNGWFLLFGTALLVAPLVILGAVQNAIGRALSKKDNIHSWVYYGKNKMIVAFMVMLIALGYVVLFGTVLFKPLAIIFLIIVLLAAAFMKKSPDPIDALKRVSFVFVASSLILFMLTIYESTNRYITSVATAMSNITLLRAVENEDMNVITENVITETESSPTRKVKKDSQFYYSEEDINSSPNRIIKEGEVVTALKSRPTFTDSFGRIWVFVKYETSSGYIFTGYIPNVYLETVRVTEN